MSRDLISSIQRETDLRLILPFGLNLKPGDVVSVADSGDLGLEGSAQSVLGMPAGKPRRPGKPVNLFRQVGKDVSCEFRAAGRTSSLFPELPKASAKVDVKFRTASSWVLAMTGRRLSSLDEINRFRQPIVDAFRAGVWRKDWALVTSLASAGAMTLLAANSKETKLALTLNGTVDVHAAMEAKLTAGARLAAASKEVTNYIIDERAPVACVALRVKDRWLRRPGTGYLRAEATRSSPRAAADEDFWEPLAESG